MPVDLKTDDMGDVIKDFYKSDAPQFKGKSKKKRREMAIAAKLSAESALYFREAKGKWTSERRRKWLDRAEKHRQEGNKEKHARMSSAAISMDTGNEVEARNKMKKRFTNLSDTGPAKGKLAARSDKRDAIDVKHTRVNEKLGEGKIERVMDTVRKYTNRKKKPKKQNQYPAGASHKDAGDVARQTLIQRQREKSVGPFKPIDYRGI